MNINSSKIKLILGTSYLVLILIGLYFLVSAIDPKDLLSYEFIKSNKDLILKYKNDNFIFLAFLFFIFSIIWILLLGFALPLLLFAGFVFGKWWGILIIIISTTIGATLLYVLAGYFFRELINTKLAPKFSNLKKFFKKNDTIYFMIYRFIGGGGIPYAVQNIFPILFDMPVKNYFIATLFGSAPSMFVTVALGSGVSKVINQNIELSFSVVLFSPDIYIPIIGFFIILIISFFIKKFYFNK